MSYVLPPLVTEHQPGPDDKCVECSGIMQLLARWPGRCAHTLAEADALRTAEGLPQTGGANTYDLIKGITARYGAMYAPTAVKGWPAAWASVTLGHSLTVSGVPANCPIGSPIRRWVGELHAGHRIFGARIDSTQRLWIMDPEGPADGSYKGEWCSQADLASFASDPNRVHSLQALLKVSNLHTLHIAPNATIRIATVTGGCISKWTDRKWGATASSAPCSAPYTLKGCSSGSASVVKVTKGVFIGKVVKASSPGVSVT